MSTTTMLTQLGAHLKNLRKFHVVREHARLASSATHNRRLLLVNTNTAYSTSDNEEARAFGEDVSHLDDQLVPGLQDLYVALRDEIQGLQSWFGVVASELALDVDDLGDPIEYVYSELDGEITIAQRKGPLGALHGRLTSDKVVVIANVVTAGAIAASPTNTGELAATTVTADKFFPNCPTGTLTFVCTDATISAPKFSVKHAFDTAAILADGTASLEGESELQTEKPYRDGAIGINGIVLSRPGLAAPEELLDDANILSAITVATPHEDDCDDGKFYFTIARDATNWLVYIFRAAARNDADLVAQTFFTIAAPGTEVISMTCTNGSVVAFTFSHTNALVEFPDTVTGEEIDAYIDIGMLAVGDTFTIAVTNEEAGAYSTKLMHAWRAHLPSGPAKPSSALVDNLAGAGAGNVDNGSYLYVVSYVALTGESGQGTASGGVTVTDKTTNGKVALSSIPTGPAGTTARKIYRSNDAGATYRLLTTISDNVTTTYEDNIASATIAANATPLTEFSDALAASVQLD